MTRDATIQKHYDAFEAALVEARPAILEYHELDKAVPETAATPEILDAQVQKALVVLLKQKLDADPSLNQRFAASTKVPLWNQLLLAARVKELSRARIVKKSGAKKLRYDVGDLAKTFFGKALLAESGLKRQTVLDGDELAKLEAACAKIKLTLPQTVEPTTTELFFDEDKAAAVAAARAAKAAAAKPKKPKKKASP